MSRYSPMDPRQTNRNGILTIIDNGPTYLGGFNNAFTTTNQLMNEMTWI